MTREGRGQVASRRSFVAEAAMADMLLAAKGYSVPPEITVIESMPRYAVVASSHKVVNGERVVASALGRDDIDATRNLVKVVTRP